MYQSGIKYNDKTGKYGLWINGYGYAWFETREEAEEALKNNPIV